jgi:hypothetical protein
LNRLQKNPPLRTAPGPEFQQSDNPTKQLYSNSQTKLTITKKNNEARISNPKYDFFFIYLQLNDQNMYSQSLGLHHKKSRGKN